MTHALPMIEDEDPLTGIGPAGLPTGDLLRDIEIVYPEKAPEPVKNPVSDLAKAAYAVPPESLGRWQTNIDAGHWFVAEMVASGERVAGPPLIRYSGERFRTEDTANVVGLYLKPGSAEVTNAPTASDAEQPASEGARTASAAPVAVSASAEAPPPQAAPTTEAAPAPEKTPKPAKPGRKAKAGTDNEPKAAPRLGRPPEPPAPTPPPRDVQDTFF